MAERAAVSSSRAAGANAARPRGLTRSEHAVHGVAIAGFVIQAVTGFGGDYFAGGVSGWLLFIHMLGAGPFVLGLAGVALMWAERCSFGSSAATAGGELTFAQKVLFWITTVLGLVVALSMLAAMLPVFGYIGQAALVEVHEISALLLLAALIVHTFVSLAVRWSKR
jgi:hypothetical protein